MPLTNLSGPLDFETVYRDYHKNVYNYIYGQVLHREAAEDLTADVFVIAGSNLSRFDPARGEFAPWLFTIARNLTLNYLVRSSTRLEEIREELPEKAAPVTSAWDDSLRSPESRRAEHILEQLSVEERRFLELRYVLGLSNEEIGRIEGTTATAISQRYHRLLAKCRKLDKNL